MDNDNDPYGMVPDGKEWLTETDRKRRMLTRDDRKYLKGEKKIEDSTKHSTNHRIRKRIHGAIRDFSFIIETGSSPLISSPDDAPVNVKKRLMLNFIHSSILYAYSFLYDNDPNSDESSATTDSIDHIEELIADAVRKVVVGGDYARVDSVNVDINIEGVTSGEQYLLDQFMKNYETTETNIDRWYTLGGDIKQLEERLEEEGEELKVWDKEMNHVKRVIKPGT